MSTNQTKSQRLAEACDAEQLATVKRDILMHDVAALLRRQEELLRQALEALLITCAGNTEGKGIDAIQAIRAHREAK